MQGFLIDLNASGGTGGNGNKWQKVPRRLMESHIVQLSTTWGSEVELNYYKKIKGWTHHCHYSLDLCLHFVTLSGFHSLKVFAQPCDSLLPFLSYVAIFLTHNHLLAPFSAFALSSLQSATPVESVLLNWLVESISMLRSLGSFKKAEARVMRSPWNLSSIFFGLSLDSGYL